MAKRTDKNDPCLENEVALLFETSWEVCNKIGGIYTVLSTKARELQKVYGDRLVFIGPDVWTGTESPVFIERKTLLKSASSKLNLPDGLSIRVGRWNIPGSPIVVLVNFRTIFDNIHEVYGRMWERFGVDSLHAYGDYDESCAFAVASAKVIMALTEYLKADPSNVIAHFDEWTTGMGLLYLKANMPEAATIFTTHATSIGRSICGNGKNLYQYFEGYNGDQMARELNMEAKHSLEKIAAREADCFTTVSDVTARECTQLLDVTPDVVTPNGFEPDFVPERRKYTMRRNAGRSRLLHLGSVMSGRKLADDTLIIATSGRNEYRNKGLDLFIDSVIDLGENNNPEGKDILALVLVPAWMKEPNGDLLMDMDYEGIDKPECDWMTHRLNNEDLDAVCCRLRQLGREGRGGKVKILYIPCYLDGFDGIVNISYYDILPAIDITVFPSYYEPWGYTPLESVAFSVPTVTTDKAGFGQWVLNNFKNGLTECGVKVISREDTNYQEDIKEISTTLGEYLTLDASGRSAASKAACATSRKADWTFFIKDYLKAFKIAFSNASKRN